MSGHIHFVLDGNRWDAACDRCKWRSGPRSFTDATNAQARHETGCRPPLPDEIPDVEFPSPPCSICDGDLHHDGDGWYCQRCEVTWSNSGADGEYVGDEVTP